MKLERLSEQNQKYYAAAKALYEEAFPVLERRDDLEQARIMQNPAYHFDFITDEDGFVGIMLYWETDSFVYLEHFAILPELRCKGKATAALGILEEQSQKTVILEIEPPCDDTSIRRYRFYQRSGFVMNPHEHLQAKYHLGDADLYLKILTYPREISKDEYAAFRKFVDAEVAVNDEIVVRPMQDCDDRMQVANLIYMTDKYIYPYWFDSAEDGAKVIAKMTSLPTLYNQKISRLRLQKTDVLRAYSFRATPPSLKTRSISAKHSKRQTCRATSALTGSFRTITPKWRRIRTDFTLQTLPSTRNSETKALRQNS